MPVVKINTNAKLSSSQCIATKSKLGKLIELIPGKSEERLMVIIQDNQTMYFKGVDDICMFVEVDFYKQVDISLKEVMVKEFSSFLELENIVEKAQVYFSFSEYENWGTNGMLK